MVVPVGKKVRVLLTSNDVIHAWMVPAFGVKQDAIPGFVRDSWFRADKVGIYRGQCAELCGKDHGFMPIVVEVLPAEKYTAWVGEQRKKIAAAADDLPVARSHLERSLATFLRLRMPHAAARVTGRMLGDQLRGLQQLLLVDRLRTRRQRVCGEHDVRLGSP